MMRINILFALVALALISQSAQAGLRCGTRLVNEGDHQAKVFQLCGKPDWVKNWSIYRSGVPAPRVYSNSRANQRELSDEELLWHRKSVVEVDVEQWTYNFGPQRLMKQIRFENSLVVDIDTLGYGYSE